MSLKPIPGYVIDQSEPAKTIFVEMEGFAFGGAPGQVVTILHGIMGPGLHVPNLKYFARQQGLDLAIESANYGWVGPLQFLAGIGAKKCINRAKADLQQILEKHPNARHSLVAHSNGCKVCSAVLKDLRRQYTFIFYCGSVCLQDECPTDDDYSEEFINDCSPADKWPILAEAVNPFMFKATGVFGFRKPFVNDRYFSIGHSDFLKQGHFERHIIPVLLHKIMPLGDRPSMKVSLQTPARVRGLLIITLLCGTICLFLLGRLLWRFIE